MRSRIRNESIELLITSDDRGVMEQREVCEALGITKQRVSQIEKRAIRSLWQYGAILQQCVVENRRITAEDRQNHFMRREFPELYAEGRKRVHYKKAESAKAK